MTNSTDKRAIAAANGSKLLSTKSAQCLRQHIPKGSEESDRAFRGRGSSLKVLFQPRESVKSRTWSVEASRIFKVNLHKCRVHIGERQQFR